MQGLYFKINSYCADIRLREGLVRIPHQHRCFPHCRISNYQNFKHVVIMLKRIVATVHHRLAAVASIRRQCSISQQLSHSDSSVTKYRRLKFLADEEIIYDTLS